MYCSTMVRESCLINLVVDNNEPMSYGEAMVGLDPNKWLETMKSEIGSMYENKVMALEILPEGKRPFRINGSLIRRQTLMVISPFMKLDLSQRSFWQVQGVDCDETFSIIVMLKSIRIMFAVAAFSFMKSGRWMSKQSFLDGFREERLYVIQ